MSDETNPGREPGLSLDPSADEIRAWGRAAVEAMAGYLDSLGQRRVYPKTTARQIREQLEPVPPDEGVDFDRLLKTFDDVIVATGRRAKAPAALASQGAQCLSQALRIYASEETHHSIAKAAALLGIGSDNVHHVGVDENFKIRIDDLVAKIEEDLKAGHLPFCVVANAGTVATGAFDPLAQVSEVARRFNLWMHVDASYGGFAALAQSVKGLFDALPEADSIALDPHKWLYLPVDCGCVLYRDAEAARATFAHEAE